MRTGVKIVLGCLAAPFVLAFMLGVVALAYRAAPIPASEQGSANLEQALPVTLAQLAAEGLDIESGIPAGRATTVNLWLEEGSFDVRPGPEGSEIRVEGNYDRSVYDLKQEMTADRDGNPVYTLEFLPKYSLMRRILSQGGVHIDDDTNNLTVWLPRGVPMKLHAQIRKGESHMDLGGLALESATIDLEMGDHEMRVDAVNPIPMTTLALNIGMGEVTAYDLGNLRAESINVFGKMGEVKLDLGREVLRDTKLYAKMRMGEMSIGLPREANVSGSTNVWLGGASGTLNREGADAAAATGPKVQVQGGITFGEVKYYYH